MLIFLSGGVRSGKSVLGEKLAEKYARDRKVYLATADICDAEMERRIDRHRRDREGKGFYTIEQYKNIGDAAELINPHDAVLMDCLGALLANEMFADGLMVFSEEFKQALFEKILAGLWSLRDACAAFIVVSNDVFSDGAAYDRETMDYIDVLAKLHRSIAAAADAAVECACGISIVHKGVI